MASLQDEVQPAPVQRREVDPAWSEEELPERQHIVPMEKSGVYVDPMARHAPAKFEKNKTVHMSVIEHGARTKGTFTIKKARISPYGYWEYQLSIIDGHGKLYKDGEWVREKELKAESTQRR
ncbi:hypothetical protein DPSP01_011247 [Paraphaeosphaeria sporulosa]|uniref:Uncharacterized protein n=1 Tax=Paraphaeosphaeria sporulosa TaxID=1460663 RepID=A0A177BY03_9PLEO|nr:uncharacterized protein CC84DRAFT_1222589 [Paraphaeosphaeria sporulosa]OAF99568.1 hypothetical protein CC84DRAFT_1222589 [Paraphaeosphaeria sporulosa]